MRRRTRWTLAAIGVLAFSVIAHNQPSITPQTPQTPVIKRVVAVPRPKRRPAHKTLKAHTTVASDSTFSPSQTIGANVSASPHVFTRMTTYTSLPNEINGKTYTTSVEDTSGAWGGDDQQIHANVQLPSGGFQAFAASQHK